jgi:hypothetical protein
MIYSCPCNKQYMPRIFFVRCSSQNELKQSAQAILASMPHTSQRCDGHIQRSKKAHKNQ